MIILPLEHCSDNGSLLGQDWDDFGSLSCSHPIAGLIHLYERQVKLWLVLCLLIAQLSNKQATVKGSSFIIDLTYYETMHIQWT